ncbi:hypothetical protein [Microbulbifer sp. TRSA007]|uniref:hypothetical protein n=1 Tax=Microbulbifer sp. TRSA007 TaxID=3243384 RepID=UPI00403A22E4
MTFNDGSTRKAVTIGSDSQAQVLVKSTAQMGVLRNRVASSVVAEASQSQLIDFAFAELHEPDVFWDVPISIPDMLIPDQVTEGGVTLDNTPRELLLKTASAIDYANKLQGDFALGFLLGVGGDSIAFKAGELAAGLLLLGDVRDAGLQQIYQLTGSADYNQVTHILSNIGILTSLGAAGGYLAGGVPGVIVTVIDGLVAAGKIATKVYDASSPMMKALGPHLTKVYNGLKNNSDKVSLETTVSFLEVYIAFSLMGDEMINFFQNAITPDNFEYVLSYIQRLVVESGEQVAFADQYSFLKVAHAAPTKSFIKLFEDLARETIEFGKRNDISAEEMSGLFASAITALERGLSNAKLGNIENREEAMKALVMAVKYGPQGADEVSGATAAMVAAAEKLGSNAARADLFNSVQRINWKKLFDEADDSVELSRTLASTQGPFGYLSISPSTAKAAAMMFEQIAKAQELGLSVVAIEKKIDINDATGVTIATGKSGTREVDLVFKSKDVNGKVKYIELKGWGRTIYLKDGGTIGTGKWMANQLSKPGSQIYKDIILFTTKREDLGIEAFHGVQWYVKKEAVDSLGGVNKMIDDVLDGVDKNRAYFSKVLDVKAGDEKAWGDFMKVLSDSMRRNGDEFFKVVD